MVGKTKEVGNKVQRGKKFSCQEMCAIIKIGAESNVSKINFEGFSVEYSAQSQLKEPEKIQQSGKFVDLQETNSSEKDSILEDEIDLKEDELANMAITDPKAFEDLVAQGELEDVGE